MYIGKGYQDLILAPLKTLAMKVTFQCVFETKKVGALETENEELYGMQRCSVKISMSEQYIGLHLSYQSFLLFHVIQQNIEHSRVS